MNADELLAKLSSGDPAAAEAVFRAYEPYLRMVVRRQLPAHLRGKFDSSDIVQSIWADLLDGFRNAGWRFADAAHLRAFLVRVTHNRFLDRLRQHQRALAHERPLGDADPGGLPDAGQPHPSEVVQARDLWERLLALCPPAHRGLLELKRQGLPLADIAARTGLHPSSVRRILYDLARRLDADELLGDPAPPTDPDAPAAGGA
jgi:RNA polymerase sigma-70 factor (ECF subfamily)